MKHFFLCLFLFCVIVNEQMNIVSRNEFNNAIKQRVFDGKRGNFGKIMCQVQYNLENFIVEVQNGMKRELLRELYTKKEKEKKKVS